METYVPENNFKIKFEKGISNSKKPAEARKLPKYYIF